MIHQTVSAARRTVVKVSPCVFVTLRPPTGEYIHSIPSSRPRYKAPGAAHPTVGAPGRPDPGPVAVAVDTAFRPVRAPGGGMASATGLGLLQRTLGRLNIAIARVGACQTPWRSEERGQIAIAWMFGGGSERVKQNQG